QEERANAAFVRLCDQKARREALKSGDACVGAPHNDESAALKRIELRHTTSAPMWDAIFSEMANVHGDARAVQQAQRAYGNLPLIVLAAVAAEAQGAARGTSAAQIAADTRLWKQMRARDAASSRLGVSCVISGVGHYIQLERPQAVVDAVLHVIESSRNHVKPRC
ncbi:MAG: hypothetical protein M3R35_08465, partial [Candidatus Eremiobacteraeota bacterium]|nr:hypothetical protein [Candidatus Eremiobacteraeota bacterium]